MSKIKILKANHNKSGWFSSGLGVVDYMSKIKILKANHNIGIIAVDDALVVDYMSKIKILKANHNFHPKFVINNLLLTICQR